MEEGDRNEDEVETDDYFDKIEKKTYNFDIPIEPPPANLELQPCPVCSRNFNSKTYTKHVVVCEKVATKKRKAFDSSRQRREGTDFANYLPKNYGIIPIKREADKSSRLSSPQSSTGNVAEPVVQRPPETHPTPKAKESPSKPAQIARKSVTVKSPVAEEKKEVKEPAKAVAKRSFSQQPSDQCPYCDRCFGLKAFDRHVEWCKEKSLIGKNNSSASILAAKERLQARIKYKAPASKKECEESPVATKKTLIQTAKKSNEKKVFVEPLIEITKVEKFPSTDSIVIPTLAKQKKIPTTKNTKRVSVGLDKSLDNIMDLITAPLSPDNAGIKHNSKLGRMLSVHSVDHLQKNDCNATGTSLASSLEDLTFDRAATASPNKKVKYLYKNPKTIKTTDKIIHNPCDEKIPFINNIQFKTENIITPQEDSSTTLLIPPFYEGRSMNSKTLNEQNNIMIKEFQTHHHTGLSPTLDSSLNETLINDLEYEPFKSDSGKDQSHGDESSFLNIMNADKKSKPEQQKFLSSKEKSFIIEKSDLSPSKTKNQTPSEIQFENDADTIDFFDDGDLSTSRFNDLLSMNLSAELVATKVEIDLDADKSRFSSKSKSDSAYRSISKSQMLPEHTGRKSVVASTSTTSLRNRLRATNRNAAVHSSGSETSVASTGSKLPQKQKAKDVLPAARAESKLSKFCHQCGMRFHLQAKYCMECGIKRIVIE